jgi:hypothetical protein
MKILIAAVNSQYVHSNPAPYALARAIEEAALSVYLELHDYTINLPPATVLADIWAAKPDLVCFSTYIWNITYIAALAADVKKILPETLIIAGGGQATAAKERFFTDAPAVDVIITGEGEIAFTAFVSALLAGEEKPHIQGVLWQGETFAKLAPLPDLADLSFPYDTTAQTELKGKIIYYESSRGCPFGCTFCASALEKLRYRPLELVEKDLQQLAAMGGQIKFVDRTFNADPARAVTISKMVLALYREGLSWHFEISPYLLTDELIEVWQEAPAGYLKIEAGVQSLNPQVLAAINRNGDWQKAKESLSRIISADNVHVHLDLIAGLPEETPESFAAAFAQLHNMAPHYIQLGFLKVLPGSLMEQNAASQGIIYSENPPYRVLATHTMSAEYLFYLVKAESTLNQFYNTNRFCQSLHYAAQSWPDGAMAFYAILAEKVRNYPTRITLDAKLQILSELLLPLDKKLFFNLLRLDWFLYGDGQKLPPKLCHPDDHKNQASFDYIFEFQSRIAKIKEGNCRLAFDWRHKLVSSARYPVSSVQKIK